MLKRVLFILIFIGLFPIIILGLILSLVLLWTCSPVIWIITGNADRAIDFAFNGVTEKLIFLPWVIVKID